MNNTNANANEEEEDVCLICLEQLPFWTNTIVYSNCCGKGVHEKCHHQHVKQIKKDMLRKGLDSFIVQCMTCRKPLEPRGSQKDFQNIKKWADQGRTWACLSLAGLYLPKDKALHDKYTRIAAERGQPIAQHNLGLSLKEKNASMQDLKEGFQWLLKAAKAGNPGSMYSVGLCYARGKGVKRNMTKAIKWYEKGAKMNEPDAIYTLGVCYETGEGKPHSYQKAVECYRRGSDLGDVTATYNLAGVSQYI